MNESVTAIYSNMTIGTYIVVGVYFLSVIISIFICLTIIYLTYVTPDLHTPTNLLLSNTSLCSLFFSSVLMVDAFYYCMQLTTTDWSCRVRGYLTYTSGGLVLHSLVIQAISRLFWTVLYKHRYLLTMKCHVYLIFSQIFFSFLFPLSTFITKNIVSRPFQLCLVPIQYKIHLLYLVSVIYIIPVLNILILYFIIYRHTKNSSLNTRRLLHGRKRDRRLARNILILLSIFLFGGLPWVIYIVLSSKIASMPIDFYLFSIAAIAIAIIFEKIAIIILNKEIGKAMRQQWIAFHTNFLLCFTRTSPVFPSNNTNRPIIRTISRISPTITAPKTQKIESNSL